MNGMMPGDLRVDGRLIQRAGFMAGGPDGLGLAALSPMGQPQAVSRVDIANEWRKFHEQVERGEVVGDLNAVLNFFDTSLPALQRGITSTMTAFPVRENLEAESKILTPLQTPVRNRIPRTPGSGLASKWKQTTSLGGGYAVSSTTVTSGATSATQQVGSTAGYVAGSTLYFATAAVQAVVSSVTDSTHVVLTTSVASTTSEVVSLLVDNPGASTGAIQAFFGETGAPATHTSVYADKSASYKLLGVFGSISGLSIAGGANFQNQYNTESRNAILNLMLNEESALINGSSTAVTPPWGDGTNAWGFDGLVNLSTTGNGVPTAQVQTAVGPLTTDQIDGQLTNIWKQGGEGNWMIMNGQEIQSLTRLAQAAGSIIRVMATPMADGTLGFTVTGYKHPVTGEIVPIMASRFIQAGTIIYGSDRLPDGSPALDVDVLPQVQLPELAPNEAIQGYTKQDLAPSLSAPQVYPFIVTVFEVLRMKAATVFAKSTGVTAA